jgi:xylan 1,4-beta-xylosidase
VNHSEVVLRSESVWGPYVPYDKNPILTQRHLPENRKDPVTSTGHAQLVEGPDGNTYAIFLAVRPYRGNFYNTGRETFIAPVSWIDGWPVINPGHNEVLYKYDVGYKEVKQKDARPQSGAFDYTITFEKELDPALLFLRTVDSSAFTLDKANGLTLRLKPETCMDLGHPAFIGKRQQHLNCVADTEVKFDAKSADEKAGLVIFQNEQHFYYICKSVDTDGKPVVQLYKSTKENAMELVNQAFVKNGNLMLRIVAEGEWYNFYYADKPNNWKLLNDKLDGTFLSTAVADSFIGCVFGMYATSSGAATTNVASFKFLRYSGSDNMNK